MAPSGGFHQLIAKNAQFLRLALKKTSRFIQSQISDSHRSALQPAFARNVLRQPVHPVAALRQSKRWHSTYRRFDAAVRQFTSSVNNGSAGVKYHKASFPQSRIGAAVNASSGRAPFASTLRPNLTGGALPRTAGGYGMGAGRIGGARYFSHGPAVPTNVVQNVSQAVRAFFISGQKAQYDGTNKRTGAKKYRAVSAVQEETGRKLRDLPKATPGSYIDFNVNPTITALTPMQDVTGFSVMTHPASQSLSSEGLLDVLAVDFSRSLKDLAAILNDLQRLSTLGDLPITYQSPHAMRVHFPGCDADTVERLCAELGITRGIVYQDPEFEAFAGTEIALLFPFAPSQPASEGGELFETAPLSRQPVQPKKDPIEWHNMLTPPLPSAHTLSEEFSMRSERSEEDGVNDILEGNPWASGVSPSGYETVHSSELDTDGADRYDPLEYQGFEGIYRFMEHYDAARR